MEAYLAELNDAQRAPTLQIDGPMIVIAGAGSGKTRVLTYRIAYMMSKGIDAFNILALTFTNKAAREMQHRISQIVGRSEAKNLWMGTFHSVFAKILRFEADKLGYPSNFTIYDTQDSQSVIRAIIKDMQLDKDVYKYKQVYSRISSYKNSLITVKAYFNNPELMEADAMSKKPRMGDIYQEYVQRCFKAGAMDFDDLLLKTNELLNRFPEVLQKYQNRFRYILVDEYQDTNHSQYLIVKALSDKFQNICVVGDDAQSIYAFRGANINNILNFQKDYDGVEMYRLEQNYRSTGNIVNAANSIIDKNQTKLDKVVWTANDDGPKIVVNRLLTDGEEGRFVASSIFENKMQQQMANGDFAILYRTNAQSRVIEDVLRRQGIPYEIIGGIKFYERAEIKDCVAYLRLINQGKDDLAFDRIVNNPKRSIGETSIKQIHEFSKKNSISLEMSSRKLIELNLIKPKTKIGLNSFLILMQKWRTDLKVKNMNHVKLLQTVLDESGYSAMLKNKKDLENENRLENIKELLSAMKEFDNLNSFLEHVALATSIDQNWEGEKVNLMTMHGSKGLEFDVVFLPGWEEGLFPHQKSIEEKGQNGLEEERRLAYVGITRAKKLALISFSMNRFYQGDWIDSMASRFIEELPEKNLEKNSLFDDNGDNEEDFEFNQDFEIEEGARSPGWIRYQKKIK